MLSSVLSFPFSKVLSFISDLILSQQYPTFIKHPQKMAVNSQSNNIDVLQLLEWVNSTLQSSLSKIEDLSTGTSSPPNTLFFLFLPLLIRCKNKVV